MIASGIQSPPSTPGFFNSTPTPSKLLISDSRSPSTDPAHIYKTARNQPSPPSGMLDDDAIADVKVHYCSQVYEAVLVAITQSLNALIRKLDWRQSLNTQRYVLMKDYINIPMLPFSLPPIVTCNGEEVLHLGD